METQGTRYMLRGLLGILLFTSSASAHPIVQYWQNRASSLQGFRLHPQITHTSSSRNFDSAGQSITLPNSIQTQRFYFDLNASFGVDERLTVFGRASLLNAQVTGTGLNNPSLLGLSDQLLGGSYQILETSSGASIWFQGDLILPAYINSTSVITGKPFLGDGSIDLIGGAFLNLPLHKGARSLLSLEAGAGLMYRSKGYSSGIPWTVRLFRTPTLNGLSLSAGARGLLSLESDTTPTFTAALDQNRGAGGSYLINAINPSWIMAHTSLGYRTESRMTYAADFSTPVFGKNSPDLWTVAFGVEIDLSSAQSPNPKTTSFKTGTFKSYTLEAKVISVNDSLYLIKIDRGSEDSVEKGQIFDIFNDNQLVARAKVSHVKSDESALRVIEYFKEQSINENAIAKRVSD